jgi:hypothetical protein
MSRQSAIENVQDEAFAPPAPGAGRLSASEPRQKISDD